MFNYTERHKIRLHKTETFSMISRYILSHSHVSKHNFKLIFILLNVISKDIPKCMKRFPGAKDFSKRQRTKKKARKSIKHNRIDKRGRRIFICRSKITSEHCSKFQFRITLFSLLYFICKFQFYSTVTKFKLNQ